MNPQLESIAQLIKTRQFEQARAELKQYLERSGEDAEAWYLRSLVEPEHAQKIAAAKQAAALDPGNDRYNDRLAKLQAASRARPPAEKRRRRSGIWLLAALGVALIALVVVAVILLRGGQGQQAVVEIPTLIVLPSFTPTPEPTASPTPEPTNTPSATSTPEPTESETVQRLPAN
jgi:ferric-dicitrate binding protein FerR (iron transport regulator)